MYFCSFRQSSIRIRKSTFTKYTIDYILSEFDDELGTFSTRGSSDSDDDNFDEVLLLLLLLLLNLLLCTTLYFIASHFSALLDDEKNDDYFPFPYKPLDLSFVPMKLFLVLCFYVAMHYRKRNTTLYQQSLFHSHSPKIYWYSPYSWISLPVSSYIHNTP